MVTKKTVVSAATIGMAIGSYAPVLIGDTALLDGWSVLGGFVGGIAGIAIAVWLGRRYGW